MDVTVSAGSMLNYSRAFPTSTLTSQRNSCVRATGSASSLRNLLFDNNDRITGERVYFDNALLLRQLGVEKPRNKAVINESEVHLHFGALRVKGKANAQQ